MAGTLFVVATPIGNLEDLTFRALRTLREVDLVAAEDTRHTLKLLTHYEIRKPLVSLREHNEVRETPRLIARLARGEQIALVTDAGTPGLADPGARLVQAARAASIATIPIPGPSALTAALSVAGLESSDFVFRGFAPARQSERSRWFAEIQREWRAVIFFEAPHRIASTIAWLKSNLVNRQIDTVREISKINYELVNWSKMSAAEVPTELGEVVVVVHQALGTQVTDDVASKAFKLVGHLINECGLTEEIAVDSAALSLNMAPEFVVRAIRLGRKLAKQQKMVGS